MAKGKIKVHSLTGRITSKLVFEAWRAVRRNRGAAGIDKVSIQMFEQNLDANLDRLMRELKQRTYQPLPARRVYIPKDAKATKFRPLGIPTVRSNRTCPQRVFGVSYYQASISSLARQSIPCIEVALCGWSRITHSSWHIRWNVWRTAGLDGSGRTFAVKIAGERSAGFLRTFSVGARRTY